MNSPCPICGLGRHPSWAPITPNQLTLELNELLTVASAFVPRRKAHLIWHHPLDEEHRDSCRRYAQVIPGLLQFEVSEAILYLDRPHRRGLLAHEVGHCIAPNEGESGADRAALRVLGTKIDYDARWPGKGLQVIW